ncbi:MAG: hypothetical protein M1812_007249 [Candelaria pacifica]|nr:MAG: hypothetical protein M1812_007249 [Candelaria pacifica]
MDSSKRTPSLMSNSSTTRSIDSRVSMTPTSQGFMPRKAENQEPSALLHDRLREKKAQGRGFSNSYSNASAQTASYGRDDGIFDDDNTNFTHVDGRLVQSSPAGPPRSRDKARGASAISSQNDKVRGMGAKEMTEYVSTMHKQNFDLKMEVFHRRQRVTALEEQLERYKTQQTENEELQEVNEQLLAELEKRDRAVEEAVGIICELEEKVEGLEQKVDGLQDQLADTRPSTAQPDTECFTTDREDSLPPSSPPDFHGLPSMTPVRNMLPTQLPVRNLIDLAAPMMSKTPVRKPSFLTSNSGSHNALRSLYRVGEDRRAPFAPSSTRDSMLSDVRSEKDLDYMNSPRLSVLSESSFLSVYGDKREQKVVMPPAEVPMAEADHQDHGEVCDTLKDNTNSAAPKRMNMARVNDWIEERARSPGGSIVSSISSEHGTQIEPTEDKLEPPDNTIGHNPATQKSREGKRDQTKMKQLPFLRSHEQGSQTSGDMGFNREVLPPTPDTMSNFEKLPSLNHSASSIIAEKSLLDGTPTPARSYSALKPKGRPQSSRKVVTRPSEEHMSEYEDDVESSLAPIFPSPTDFNFTHLTDKAAGSSKLGRDFMFNGADIPSSRPLRPANERSHSMQPTYSKESQHTLASPNNPRSHLTRMETAPLSPNEWRSESSNTETPTRESYLQEHGASQSISRTTPTSPIPYHQERQPQIPERQHHPQYRQASDSKLPLPHTRHRPATAATASSQQMSTKKQSLTSRIFRRSNSHSSDSPSTEPQQPASQLQTPIPNIKQKQQKPRPSSVYTSEALAGNKVLSGTKMPRPSTSNSLEEKSKNTSVKTSEPITTAAAAAVASKGTWNLPVVGSMGLGRSSSLKTPLGFGGINGRDRNKGRK